MLKGDGTLSMKADYLPYGGLITGGGLNVAENDYLWTGKELQHQLFETPSYDSSARLLFTNGLFASPDPLAEKYPGVSPYAYCAGNPVKLTDSNGMFPQFVIGAIIGGVVNGGIALCQGKTGKEVLGAFVGGAIYGAITATTFGANVLPAAGAAITRGFIGGTLGSIAEQWIGSDKVDYKTMLLDGVSGAIASFASSKISLWFKNLSSKSIQAINQKYESTAVHDAVYHDVKAEYKNAGYRLGPSTKKRIKKEVTNRIETLARSDKAMIQGSTYVADRVQEQIVETGMNKIKNITNE